MATNSVAQQAATYASAAVPTLGSINRQYGRAAQDTTGFTKALVGLLSTQAGAPSPYAGAIASQTAADKAAVARLTSLGLGGAGAAAAVGGMGDSALGALNAARGATGAYLSKMPGVAAATGQAGLRAIQSAKSDAISQRNETYRSALVQAQQQLEQFGLQKAQLNQSAKQSAQSLAEQRREFDATNAFNIAKLAAEKSGTFSPAQIASYHQTGVAAVSEYIGDGTPIGQAIKRLVNSAGIPAKLARGIALSEYANMGPAPTRDQFTKSVWNAAAGRYLPAFNKGGFQSATRAWTRAHNSYMNLVHPGWNKHRNPADFLPGFGGPMSTGSVGAPLSSTRRPPKPSRILGPRERWVWRNGAWHAQLVT